MKHRQSSGLHPRMAGTGSPAARTGRDPWPGNPAEQCDSPADLWDRWSDCRLWPDCVDADGGPVTGTLRNLPAA